VELIPAIDLLEGHVVRLRRGAYDAVTRYADDPVTVALAWRDAGATRLHLVDLEGAREGRPTQARIVSRIVHAVGIPCQVAGGIRSPEAVTEALENGADRVILGSALVADPGIAAGLVGRHGADRVAAALDVRDGRALADGWVPAARGRALVPLAERLAEAGLRTLVVTAIARDGMMAGPDLELLDEVRRVLPSSRLIASGGIASLSDVAAVGRLGCAGVILGRALYEGAFSLREAQATLARGSGRLD
jgi:phosphoribosylformimino-5-aminoimidazole carboxamide ribotide isomerase